jgi:hypothetical protein
MPKNLVCVSLMALCASAGTAMATGPDVIVGDLHQVRWWGFTSDSKQAYSVGTISCNIGDQDLLWIQSNNQHPVIGQSLYRLKDNRFEQLGQSWLKHGFFALSERLCSSNCRGTDGTRLGVGCSDPYSSIHNGTQSSLGPKSQVNAFTGAFPFPVRGVPGATGQMRRLLVENQLVDPTLNDGARYFVEGQYVTPDDAAAGNHFNNASYREVRTTGSGNNIGLDFISGRVTQRQQPAIKAWAAVDPTVVVQEVRVPDEGAFWVGYKTWEVNGTWFYEYAIFNLNSDRSGGAVRMPVPGCGAVGNQKFKGVEYHSGETWSNASWTTSVVNGEAVWASPETFAQNPSTNALRWGTMYNFRFESRRPPMAGTVTLDLFKPGAVNAVTFAGMVPRPIADFDNSGFVDNADYDAFVEAFETTGAGCDLNGDGFVDFFDYDRYVEVYVSGC